MQIPSVPPPIVTNTLPQDLAAKAVPNIQAAQPLIQHAVDPAPKSEKFNQTRNNKDRQKDPSHDEAHDPDDPEADEERGGSVNISV